MGLSQKDLERLGQDFETGWSEERIRRASGTPGPGVVDFMPAFLYKLVQEKAREEGKDDFEVIQDALKAYLIPA